MDSVESLQLREDAAYYAFALATTRAARADLRAMMLERLIAAVRARAALRGVRCRDTDVAAATRVRPWAAP